jgi:DNA polymerase IV (family X)
VTNISQLSDAINTHKIADLPGFGSKSEEKLKKSLETFQQVGSNRILLAKGLREIDYIREKLLASGLFEKVEAAGSSRRMRETVGDIDLLAITGNVESATDYFLSLDRIEGAVSRGESKVTVNLKIGITCDLRFIEPDSFGAALQYFTGSKDHNVKLRDLAISKGMKLNEYGLFAADQKIAGAFENQIYEKLGLMYIPPELREDRGEIDAALSGKIPAL